MKMSIIEALEKLKELNNYEEILVEFKDEEPISIDLEIDDIRKFADDPDQTFDLIVTEYTIRELDENGKEKLGEPLYRVVK
jgi:UDP-galactopyranose mutase